MLVPRDLGVISSDLKCLLKTELEVLETKLKDSLLANLNLSFVLQNNSVGPSSG